MLKIVKFVINVTESNINQDLVIDKLQYGQFICNVHDKVFLSIKHFFQSVFVPSLLSTTYWIKLIKKSDYYMGRQGVSFHENLMIE